MKRGYPTREEHEREPGRRGKLAGKGLAGAGLVVLALVAPRCGGAVAPPRYMEEKPAEVGMNQEEEPERATASTTGKDEKSDEKASENETPADEE